ncbi:MAG: family 43 glycosylhydrolase, partial [bacterium]
MRKPSALWAAAALVVGLVSAVSTASPATATPTTARPATRPARTTAGTYQNPLDLRLPGGKRAESCADPFVFKGRGADRNWYLYCTTDPLTTTERNADGSLVFHNIPMYRSRDLVTWMYAGDALPTKPSWALPTAGLWAPDVTYLDGRYLLYYTVPDTTLPGGGSAIGVATGPTPTGPWTDSGTPVVPPEEAPGSPGSRRWVFDPEVITVDGQSYIYYGSYFGGISARRLSADGLTSDASSERQIAIDNRYEGTFIVHHHGWYYFMGSATNCCNGPLTG